MGVRQRVIDIVVGQFVQPRGLAGRLVGWEMAMRPSNRKRNLWAVDLLEVRPTDCVLEIGFGPGVAIRALARRTSAGKVYGIDLGGDGAPSDGPQSVQQPRIGS